MAKVVRLDNLAATKVGSLIKSAKYFNGSDNEKIENGELVEIGKLLADEREIHEATVFTEGSGKYVGLVCTPEIDKTKDSTLVSDFVNEANETIRVFILQKGDIFSIANETFGGVDKYIDGTLVAEFQGTEVEGVLTYNVYEVKAQ